MAARLLLATRSFVISRNELTGRKHRSARSHDVSSCRVVVCLPLRGGRMRQSYHSGMAPKPVCKKLQRSVPGNLSHVVVGFDYSIGACGCSVPISIGHHPMRHSRTPFICQLARPLRSRWGMSDQRPPRDARLDRRPQRPDRFLPLCAEAPIPRETRKPPLWPSVTSFRPFRCGPIVSGPIDCHRGRDGRGPNN